MKWKTQNVTTSSCNNLLNSVLRSGQEFLFLFRLRGDEGGVWALCLYVPSHLPKHSESDKPLLGAQSTHTGSSWRSRHCYCSQGLPVSWKQLPPLLTQLWPLVEPWKSQGPLNKPRSWGAGKFRQWHNPLNESITSGALIPLKIYIYLHIYQHCLVALESATTFLVIWERKMGLRGHI